MTLPLICLLKKCGPEETAKVTRVLEECGFHSVRFEDVLNLVRANGTLRAAPERARRGLEGFPDGVYKDALRSLPDFIIAHES